MSYEYLMNTASILFITCYIPEFYANYVNKNANVYNVFEKITMLIATSFALGYSLKINNKSLITNYVFLFGFDTTALLMRSYYAYKNRHIEVRIKNNENDLVNDVENPIHDIELNNFVDIYS